ncbi:MAG: DUF421 domain-containing protein [Ilyomonas sp.]
MEPFEIHLSDWKRILFGNVPAEFYIELVFRGIFFYFVLVICMRLMGKRMSSQLSRNEMASLVALAAAIGVPIIAPDRGLLPGLLIAIIIVIGERLIAKRFTRSERFERISQGDIGELVCDGVLQPTVMLQTRVSRERVFAQLRYEGLKSLGNVKRLYFEASGSFTLIKDSSGKPGLSLLPDFDKDFVNRQKKVENVFVCINCGKEQKNKEYKCSNCGEKKFANAVVD